MMILPVVYGDTTGTFFDGLPGERNFDWFGYGSFVGRNRQTIFEQAFKVTTQSIFRHMPCFFQRIAFGHKARQRRTGNHVPTFFRRFEEHRERVGSICFHRSDYITYPLESEKNHRSRWNRRPLSIESP
jgi:hypothetical protein